ncbi:hypothetical protein CEXT_166231 [Caerostris extrusa]|uniref:Uncharacterized protein n=1 Tax=Caerostris extrusa TaxID=172846 RepID=A0AAV4PLC2_CAEEX|nr:hypothetical protein CEXT_166231 [Caerostris extrusa]
MNGSTKYVPAMDQSEAILCNDIQIAFGCFEWNYFPEFIELRRRAFNMQIEQSEEDADVDCREGIVDINYCGCLLNASRRSFV